MSTNEKLAEQTPAPLPWEAKAANKQYLRIVDRNGHPICDFFPFARNGGRGWDATMAIAEQIVEVMNAREAT